MTEKTCTKCGIVKPLDKFVKASKNRDGRRNTCKTCANKRKIETINRETKAKSDKAYYLKNKERITIYKKQWAIDNKEKMEAAHFKWRSKPENKKQLSEYQKNHRPEINKYKLEWHHDKYKNDPLYKIKCRARFLIKRSFTDFGINKDCKSFDVLGFTVEELITHLNKGEYTVDDYIKTSNFHIDHIIPMSYFVNLAKLKPDVDPVEIINRANSLENLRIITKYDNLSKANKICIPLINKYKLHYLLT